MMVFCKAGLAFLAVPKTGTEAFGASLYRHADVRFRSPPPLKHMTAMYFNKKVRGFIEDRTNAKLELLAVIREPVQWLGSWYRYRGRPALNGHPNSTAGVSFDQFVEAYLQYERPHWAKIGSQSKFVSDATGAVLVQHMFPYDDQKALRSFLSSALEREVEEPPWKNVSPPGALILAPSLLKALQDHRAEEFELYEDVAAGKYRQDI